MIKQILVPLDGSRLAESSLPVAAYLAKTLNASVTLLHIIEQDAPSEIHGNRHLIDSADADTYLTETAKRAFSSSAKVTWHVHSSAVTDVARSIVTHSSDEFQPDIIILTSHGNSGLRDLFFGNIAQQVAAFSGIPVLLIKPVESPIQFNINHILIPLDNESIHDGVIPIAEELAITCVSHLNLLCVIPTLETLSGERAASGNLLPSTTTAYLDMAEEIALEHFQVHLEEFQKKGLFASAEVSRGDPATVITRTAERIGVDLVIFGTHGRSGIGAFWSRSVAAGVARRIRIPILLIPQAKEHSAP
jgi:nucleotide-binding universal stress UspA family protein